MVTMQERCLSGRKSLIRNQVCGNPVPWVRIPLSPPENQMAPLWGHFVFYPSAVQDENPVRRAQQQSRMPGREATIPLSPPTSQVFDESPTGDCRMPFIFRSS
jgi:hypothetical protein